MDENVDYRDQTEVSWADESYFTANGTWLHANNVLFYFAESPFFDKSSENYTLTVQYTNSEQEADILGTRKRFEEVLTSRQGLSYVVAHDPLQPPKQVPGPDGQLYPANVWVIRKQYRRIAGDESSVNVLRYYYISNGVIHEAPTVAQVLSNRMLNIADSIGKIFSEASQFPLFSVSHGHTYVKPVQQSITQNDIGASQQSKESTPMPGLDGPGAEKTNGTREAEKAEKTEKNAESRTLLQALQMTVKHRSEYSDEVPLAGEPGSFRFGKKAEQPAKSTRAIQTASSQASGSRAATPAISRAASAVPGGK